MPDIPYNEPATILAGDTITWKRNNADYTPADGWTLTYAIRSSTVKYDVICTTSGVDYLAAISAGTSATYIAGKYAWIAYVTKGAEKHTIAQGAVTILPDLTTAGLADPRTDARIIYDSLIVAYKSYVSSSGTMSAFSVAGKSVSFKSAADIILQIEHWRRIVQSEEDAANVAKGFQSSRRVGLRMSR